MGSAAEGEVGDGELKGESDSKSPSGVEAAEAMADYISQARGCQARGEGWMRGSGRQSGGAFAMAMVVESWPGERSSSDGP